MKLIRMRTYSIETQILVGRTNVYPSNSNIRRDLKMLRMFMGKTREGAKSLVRVNVVRTKAAQKKARPGTEEVRGPRSAPHPAVSSNLDDVFSFH